MAQKPNTKKQSGAKEQPITHAPKPAQQSPRAPPNISAPPANPLPPPPTPEPGNLDS